LILRQHIPVLVTAAGVPALALVAGVLDEAIRRDAEQRGRQPGQDGSPVWRPSIDGYEHRAESDLRHALINAVREAATALVESNHDSVSAVVTELESHEWLIFRRLALYLLARHPDSACDLVAARLTDRAIVRDRGLDREYLLLLARNGAVCLDDDHRRRLLTLIDAAPQATASPSVTTSGQDHGLLEPVAPDYIARWQRDRLAAIQAVLPPEWDARYQALVAEHGEPPRPGYARA